MEHHRDELPRATLAWELFALSLPFSARPMSAKHCTRAALTRFELKFFYDIKINKVI